MTSVCLECEGEIKPSDDVKVNEVVECGECGIELEVLSVNPLTLTIAPEIEEDWGE